MQYEQLHVIDADARASIEKRQMDPRVVFFVLLRHVVDKLTPFELAPVGLAFVWTMPDGR